MALGNFGRGQRVRNIRNAWIIAFAGAAANVIPAAPASASYTQLTQSRSLSTTVSSSASDYPPGNDADNESSDALGSFADRSVNSSGSSYSPTPPTGPYFYSAGGSATASQSLQLAPTSISGSFLGNARAASMLGEANATSTSTWSTAFRVDQSTPFDLDGMLTIRNTGLFDSAIQSTNNASLSFSRQADAGGAEETLYSFKLDFFPINGSPNTKPVELAGVLEPGYVYSLVATAAGTTHSRSFVRFESTGQSTAEVAFALTVPEPAAAGVFSLCAPLLLRRRRA